MKHDEARSEVRKAYAAAACGSRSGCGCGGTPESSLALGYSEEDLAAVPDGANLGLRVLVPGGRLAVSDVVLTATLPDSVMKDVRALTGCVAGAADIASLESFLRAAGFVDIRIEPREKSREVIREWMPGSGFEKYVVSADIRALKPGGKACCGPECCA